jgi:hypothetical protein
MILISQPLPATTSHLIWVTTASYISLEGPKSSLLLVSSRRLTLLFPTKQWTLQVGKYGCIAVISGGERFAGR